VDCLRGAPWLPFCGFGLGCRFGFSPAPRCGPSDTCGPATRAQDCARVPPKARGTAAARRPLELARTPPLLIDSLSVSLSVFAELRVCWPTLKSGTARSRCYPNTAIPSQHSSSCVALFALLFPYWCPPPSMAAANSCVVKPVSGSFEFWAHWRSESN